MPNYELLNVNDAQSRRTAFYAIGMYYTNYIIFLVTLCNFVTTLCYYMLG